MIGGPGPGSREEVRKMDCLLIIAILLKENAVDMVKSAKKERVCPLNP